MTMAENWAARTTPDTPPPRHGQGVCVGSQRMQALAELSGNVNVNAVSQWVGAEMDGNVVCWRGGQAKTAVTIRPPDKMRTLQQNTE